MNHKNRWIFFLLAIDTAADIYAIGSGATILRHITKPLLMPLLILAYIMGHDRKNIFSGLMISGLFFSWLGDILLMPEDNDGLFFILGLSCFLTTHILYIFYFLKISSPEKSFFSKYPYLLMFIGIYGAGLLYFLWPYLGGLKIPVSVYALIICTMLVMALWQCKRIPLHIARSFILGAGLFVISDSILAINKFRQPTPFGEVLIMGTYVAAQVNIVLGSLTHQQHQVAEGQPFSVS
jgi:uncharacterized membrane protein YhhN